MPPKVKEAKVSKKMLAVLRQSELRALCKHLGLPVQTLWRTGDAERQEWFLSNLQLFAESNLEKLPQDAFLPATLTFIMDLQAYVTGDGKAPKYNAEIVDDPTPEVTYEEPGVWERSDEEAEEEESAEIEEEVAKELDAPVAETTPAQEPQEEHMALQLKSLKLDGKKVSKDAEKAPVAEAQQAPEAAKESAPLPTPASNSMEAKLDGDPRVSALLDSQNVLAQLMTKQVAALEKLTSEIKEVKLSLNAYLDIYSGNVDALNARLDASNDAAAFLDNGVLFIINGLLDEGEKIASLTEVPDQSEVGE